MTAVNVGARDSEYDSRASVTAECINVHHLKPVLTISRLWALSELSVREITADQIQYYLFNVTVVSNCPLDVCRSL